MSKQSYEVVVFGATSFVGQILARYLLDTFGVDGDLRWAIAGRSSAKLATLKQDLGGAADSLPVLLADADDEVALAAMCEQAKVVISTVGPYALYGSPLVKICAETGTDYCDLTGEVQWIRRMIQAHEATAKKSGARIVHCCGFDSIPSDMGVHFLQQHAQARFGAPCNSVRMRVKAMRGGMSGGTVASLMNVAAEVAQNPALRKELANPYSICPEGSGSKVRQPNVKFAEYDAQARSWVAPFVMAAINTRVVQRSNALLGGAYGPDFRYDEAMMVGGGVAGRLKATAVAGGLGGFLVAAALKPSRWVLERFVVPAPGEGPTPEQQRKGFFDLRFFGTTADGHQLSVKVTGDRDPGYGSTAKMLGQAGVCLAKDISAKDCAGGFWTPATAFGDQLIDRLRAHSGLVFEVLDA